MPGTQAMYTETIDIDGSIRVGLTDDNMIVVEDSADGFARARVAVHDPDGLARALTRMGERRTGQLARQEAQAMAGMPIDDGMRRAIFGALRRHYGRELPRAERLARLSELAESEVLTITSMTRAEGGRVLDRLAGRIPAAAAADDDGDRYNDWHYED